MRHNSYLDKSIESLLAELDSSRKNYIDYTYAALKEGRYEYAYERFDDIVELDHTHSAIIEFCEQNTAHSTKEVENGD